MSYAIKYRAEGKTTRGNKDIRCDILQDGYAPISSLQNSTYDTFTTSGTTISSAIWDGAGAPAQCSSVQTFSVSAGVTYIVSFTLTLNSGAAPYVDLDGTYIAIAGVLSASGVNAIELTANVDDPAVSFKLFNLGATNFSTSAITIFQKVVFGGSPVVISHQPPDDPFDGGVIGSDCRIRLISETDLQFEEFFTCKEKDYQVKIYFDGTNVWNGYIASEMYTEPYLPPPYEVELIAYDGVGDLRNVTYEQTGEETIKNVIENAIQDYLDVGWNWFDYVLDNQTGFGATSFYETSENGSDANNVTFSEDRFVLDSIEEYSSVYDVLDQICKTFNARFIMDRGYWRWYRPIAQRNTTHEYHYWDKGAGSTSGDENNQKALDSTTRFVGDTQMLSILPAFREFYLVHDYMYRNLLWKDFSFEYSDITTYWTATGGFSLTSSNRVGREMEQISDKPIEFSRKISKELIDATRGNYVSPVSRTATTTAINIYKYLPETHCIYMGSGDTNHVNILSVARVRYLESFTIQNTAAANYAIHAKWDQKINYATDAYTTLYIRAYNASDDVWLQEDGTWGGVGAIQFTDVGEALQWKTFEIISEELDTTYEYTIYVYITTAGTLAGSVTGTWFDNIEVNVIRLDTDPMPVVQELTESIDADYILYREYPTRALGDIDEQGYEDTIYKGYLKVYDGAGGTQLSQTWQIGGSRHQTLLEHSRDMIKCLRETPRWKLNGTIYGDNNFMTVYTHNSKVFFTNYATWDLKEMTWSGEFIEIPDASVESTNLITGWTNSVGYPWDTLTSTGAVIDSAISLAAGAYVAITNALSFDEGEEFYVTWDITKNSGTYFSIGFAGDSATPAAATGSDTLVATSTDTGYLQISQGGAANYGECTICLYRKYGY